VSSPSNRLSKHPDLTAESPDRAEFEGLVQSGTNRLKDANNKALSLESRFDLGYNAAFAFSNAALRYHGFRSSKRYVVFQVLEDTLGLKPSVWRVLATAHTARNRSDYEGASDVDERLLNDLLTAAAVVAKAIGQLPPLGGPR
jgi:hypothetical protein